MAFIEASAANIAHASKHSDLSIVISSNIEAGKRVARDLCGTEPERMAPPKFADYCQKVFANTAVVCTVEDRMQTIAQDYPLLFAVARASIEVERHQPRVIRLKYEAKRRTKSS